MQFFGDPASWPRQDVIAVTEDLSPYAVIVALAEGLFPMPVGFGELENQMGWWSPVHRGIIPLDGVRVTRSLRKMTKRYRTTVDAAFDQVLARCADPSRPDGWIDERIIETYTALHVGGYAHSVETWDAQGRLVGGLYGVGLGGLFAGESMFHDDEHGRDASKVALLRLVEVLSDDGCERMLDVQWVTDHLASLGAIEIDRDEYLAEIQAALVLDSPDWQAERGKNA